eukprot:TRINITY_DN16080_c0_g1_i1.p1 TRINITY_DN16080_c0_g1~~TRINITY_DN16080_c0_g1_i1.p1  ORF type:complete len:125 (-),score=17.44 TRINITY_DN16080_c0_g1_i1:8-382(-)
MTDFNTAIKSKAETLTGHYQQVYEKLKDKIYDYTKRKGAKHMWIGIASRGLEGCRERWNDKYKDLGMTKMRALYQTSSDDYRKRLEALLIDWCAKHGYPIDNVVAGGGGGQGTPPYVVYVAFSY